MTRAERATMKRKPKFSVGDKVRTREAGIQLVHQVTEQRFAARAGQDREFYYQGDDTYWRPESSLYPLTAQEIGPRRKGRA